MRLLLAILHTVYSRFDATGEPYEWLTIDLEVAAGSGSGGAG